MPNIQILREKLTGKINKIESTDLLEHMLQMADVEQSEVPFQLTAEQGNAASEGIEQLKKTHYIPDWESDKEVGQWVKKTIRASQTQDER